MINRLLVDKVDSMQKQGGNINREIDINKEPKRNGREQNYCSNNERKKWIQLRKD